MSSEMFSSGSAIACPRVYESSQSRPLPEKDLAGLWKSLNLYLIKPSKYDDDGYVIRYWKGVLPSNTLACLNGLSEDLRRREVFGKKMRWTIRSIDETVERVDAAEIIRQSKKKKNKTIVCLVGVQSNQFPRAADIALQLRRSGVDVLIGGFHVSGVMAMLPEFPPEILELKNAGVTLVAGEVEGRWEMIIGDALRGELKPIYNYLSDPPDLRSAPMPVFPKNLLNSYAVSRFATLDCGRGCPYACSFCTVINVQGRVMRFRSVESIVAMVRENYRQHKINFYFFTDDNFSRNKNWRAILEGLIRLRREENIEVHFMAQVDTQSHRIPDFARLLAEAGCSQVFIGLESINPENLNAAGKNQNKVEEFQAMISLYREMAIAPHLAYIIGFPFDTYASVTKDIQTLKEKFGAPQASFFMLTPLPGSADHKTAHSRKTLMDADLNNFDSFHETFRHEQMGGGTWQKAYNQAWESFYGVPNMIRILNQTPAAKYWHIFMNFIWYKNAIQVEGGHPMIHGFVRRKSRLDRRKIYPVEDRFAFFIRRADEIIRTFKGWIKLAFEMEEVWLATRSRSSLEKQVIKQFESCHRRTKEWRDLGVSQLQELYSLAARGLPLRSFEKRRVRVAVPSRFHLWFQRWNVFSERLTFTREPMQRYWTGVLRDLKEKKYFRIQPFKLSFAGFREVVLMSRFLWVLSKQL